MAEQDIDQILDKLAKDVEAAVHALYRGEVRQQTAQTRTSQIVQGARAEMRKRLQEMNAAGGASPVAVSPRPSVAAVAAIGSAVGWSPDEGEAVLKCVNSWFPVGSPRDAAPDSKCVPAGRELVPTWAQREKAREALKKIT